MIRNVKRKLKDPKIKSFNSVTTDTGIMGTMRRRTFMAILWISDVAFKVCIYHVNYILYYYCFLIFIPTYDQEEGTLGRL